MPATCKDLMDIVETMAPLSLALPWDNPGLAAGSPSDPVRRVLLALDATSEVIGEAAALEADMLITHHPLLFSPAKTLRRDTPTGAKLSALIKHNIAAYSAHTNLDIARGGVNDMMCRKAGLLDVEFLVETKATALNKIIVYVPKGFEEKVREAMFSAGAGHIGGYSHCSFSVSGEGGFMPLSGADPFIGEVGRYEKTPETRIETVVPEPMTAAVVSAMRAAHPYEEAAYDVFRLEIKGPAEGLGRFGRLPAPMRFGDFAAKFKSALGLGSMRISGNPERTVEKIALCTGAGADLTGRAAEAGAEVFITGDLRYHETQNALDAGLCLIDATHYAGENLVIPALADYIKQKAAERGFELEVLQSKINGQTFLDI